MTQARERKGRYYASALDRGQREKLIEALEIEGIDDEIALIRARLHTRVNKEELTAITGAINTIVKAVQARYRMTPQDADELVDRMAHEVELAARQIDEDTRKAAATDV